MIILGVAIFVSISGCKSVAPAQPLTCTTVIGYPTNNNNNYRMGNEIVATKFTMDVDGHINAIMVKLANPAAIIAAVYADTGTSPGDVLVQTAIYAGQAGWNAMPTPGYDLVSGTSYWLAVLADAAAIASVEPGATAVYKHASLSIDATVTALGLPPGSDLMWTDATGEIKIAALNCK